MLIEAPRRTDDGVTIVITPDGAEPIRTSVPVAGGLLLDTTVDPVVPAALLPAMHRDEALRATGGISPRLRAGAGQFQRILMSWDRHLFGEKALLRMARIEAAERRTVERGEDGRGTACFFTAGADSFHSVITNRDRLDALIHVRGFGTPPDGTPLSAMIEERLRDAARLLGLPLIEPELREDAGEIEAALAGRLPTLVTLHDLRGDLHSHSDWSDGVHAARGHGGVGPASSVARTRS